ncbi:MAG: holo-ACP synthase [Leptospiraceae bacterium]|nr:holo-ACP synthase [Leptospiraceae bacterium]MCP5513466.1 holo-ACP synthase [Leptospiraceae bacterium]
MKIRVGNDLIENSRISEVYTKFGKKFLEKVFTEIEIDYCLGKKDPIPHLAARFCCKEAFIKAIDLPDGVALDFREIELTGNHFGKKYIKLTGKADFYFREQGFEEITVSITHTENYANAVILLYGKES